MVLQRLIRFVRVQLQTTVTMKPTVTKAKRMHCEEEEESSLNERTRDFLVYLVIAIIIRNG